MSSATPADVLARRRHLILNGDADGFADLFAPDAVIEAPFAPPGAPARLEGREAIREYSRHVLASPLQIEDFEVAELYQTQDPEVVIVEMRAKGTLTTTGRPFAGPPGASARLEGREAIREYSRHVMASPLRVENYEVAELYQTQDPEVVIVEMRAKGTVTTTGRSFTATSVQILRIREGHIVLFRDFADPRVLADVIGEPRPGS